MEPAGESNQYFDYIQQKRERVLFIMVISINHRDFQRTALMVNGLNVAPFDFAGSNTDEIHSAYQHS